MKVLVRNYSDFGDLIFSTPLLRNLRFHLQGEVFCLTLKKNEDALSSNPYLSGIFFKEEIHSIYNLLSRENFNLVIDLQNDFILRILCYLKEIKFIGARNQRFREWMKVNLKIDQLSNLHYSDRLLNILNLLNLKKDTLGLDYFIPAKDEIEADWLPAGFNSDFIVVSLHSNYTTRRLPVNKLIEICDRINKPIILVGDSRETEISNQIERFFKRQEQADSFEEGLMKLNKKSTVLNLCGKLNRNQIASLIRKCLFVFSHDSWIIPVASAFKKEVFAIWGNTIPEFGKYPYMTKFKILQNNRINCRPCSIKGFNRCPKGHFKCLNEVIFDFYIPE